MRELADLREDARQQGLMLVSLTARVNALEALLHSILGSEQEPTLEEKFQANRRDRLSRQHTRERVEYMSRMV